MKRIIQSILAVGVLAFGLAAIVTVSPQPVAACTGGKNCITTGAGNVKTGAVGSLPTIITNITNILLFLLGAVSVIMLVVGGFKYTTSNGNPEQIKSAKNTIMYAIVGVVIAMAAYAIVSWVVRAL